MVDKCPVALGNGVQGGYCPSDLRPQYLVRDETATQAIAAGGSLTLIDRLEQGKIILVVIRTNSPLLDVDFKLDGQGQAPIDATDLFNLGMDVPLLGHFYLSLNAPAVPDFVMVFQAPMDGLQYFNRIRLVVTNPTGAPVNLTSYAITRVVEVSDPQSEGSRVVSVTGGNRLPV